MTIPYKCFVILVFTILISACKKPETQIPDSPDKEEPPVPRQIEGIDIIRGNNQVGYKGERLDTIVLRVRMTASRDSTLLPYYTRTSNNDGSFFVFSQTRNGDDMILRAFWHPTSQEETPSMKLYVVAGCTYEQMAKGECKEIDSVSLSASFHQPWKSVYDSREISYRYFYGLHFMDEMNGIAVGEGTGVVRTSNGGKTWSQGGEGRHENSAFIMSFSGRDTALLSITNNYASFTYDGGKTFALPDNWTPPILGHQSSCAYYLQSRDVIYTVGLNGNIAKTTDGGQTWDKSGSFNVLNKLNDITAVGKDTLFTCGSVGFIARTTDAGKTWKRQALQLNNHLNKVCFVNSSLGFVGGQYGALVRTADSGEHWEKVASGMGFSIIAIRFFDDGYGLMVSSGGEIAESKDGGRSWKLLLKGNYGVNDLAKVVIKDKKTIFGVQQGAIFNYNLK